jgi:hypothetical protein
MLPDPAFFAECMQLAFDRLQDAISREAAFTVADAVALPVAESKARRPRKRATGKGATGKRATTRTRRRADA